MMSDDQKSRLLRLGLQRGWSFYRICDLSKASTIGEFRDIARDEFYMDDEEIMEYAVIVYDIKPEAVTL